MYVCWGAIVSRLAELILMQFSAEYYSDLLKGFRVLPALKKMEVIMKI